MTRVLTIVLNAHESIEGMYCLQEIPQTMQAMQINKDSTLYFVESALFMPLQSASRSQLKAAHLSRGASAPNPAAHGSKSISARPATRHPD